MFTNLIIFIIVTIPIILTFSAFKFRKTKYYKLLRSLSIVGFILPILLYGLLYLTVLKESSAGVFQTFNCGDEIFYFSDNPYKNSTVDKKVNQDKKSTNRWDVADLIKIERSDYTATYINKSIPDSNLDPLTINYYNFQKQGFKELVNCNEFRYNALYQPAKDTEKNRCYILNRSKLTDYPDCSKEIKTEFGIV